MKILVTGAAGFIGMHVSSRLLSRGDVVTGIDNLNNYYDESLKLARVNVLKGHSNFLFEKIDLSEEKLVQDIFSEHRFDRVVHLAAQAGVRYSLKDPRSYIESNIHGFLNILEASRLNAVEHLVYASSSSVYGANSQMPFNENENVNHPLSLYGATKKANELMAHSYSSLYNIPSSGLRFFTVYGPWGRPDMALFSFTKAIIEGKAINVFNNGEMERDFTYIDDIVSGVVNVLDKKAVKNVDFDPKTPDPSTSSAPYRIFNIGNGKPVRLMNFIHVLEEKLGLTAKLNLLPMQPGDVIATNADTNALSDWVGFQPNTPIEEGIQKFVDWYLGYYKIG